MQQIHIRKGTYPYWEVTQDVIYNTGELTIDFRPYGAWDRVMVFQMTNIINL